MPFCISHDSGGPVRTRAGAAHLPHQPFKHAVERAPSFGASFTVLSAEIDTSETPISIRLMPVFIEVDDGRDMRLLGLILRNSGFEKKQYS